MGSVHQPVLALGYYARPFCIPNGLLGIWAPRIHSIAIWAFDPEELKEIEWNRLDGMQVDRAGTPGHDVLVNGNPIAELRAGASLAPGVREFKSHQAFADLDSLLTVADYARSLSDAHCAIYDFRFSADTMVVYPQEWFNNRDYDIGYQWITRVARHPTSSRFIGDGFRIGTFELSDDGCHLARWLRGSRSQTE